MSLNSNDKGLKRLTERFANALTGIYRMPECGATSGFTSQLVEHTEKRSGLSGITLSPGFFMLKLFIAPLHCDGSFI
jgi:hypothetical protein